MSTSKTVFQTIVFNLVSEITRIPRSAVNVHTIIPAEFRSEVIGRVVAAMNAPLRIQDKSNLTAGQIVEAATTKSGW